MNISSKIETRLSSTNHNWAPKWRRLHLSLSLSQSINQSFLLHMKQDNYAHWLIDYPVAAGVPQQTRAHSIIMSDYYRGQDGYKAAAPDDEAKVKLWAERRQKREKLYLEPIRGIWGDSPDEAEAMEELGEFLQKDKRETKTNKKRHAATSGSDTSSSSSSSSSGSSSDSTSDDSSGIIRIS